MGYTPLLDRRTGSATDEMLCGIDAESAWILCRRIGVDSPALSTVSDIPSQKKNEIALSLRTCPITLNPRHLDRSRAVSLRGEAERPLYLALVLAIVCLSN